MARPGDTYRSARRNHARKRRNLTLWRAASSDALSQFKYAHRDKWRTPSFMLFRTN